VIGEPVILLLMLGIFALSIFIFKIPAGVALMLAAVSGALAGGEGLAIRHLVEGSFGFLEAILIITTAMIFMKVAETSGVLPTISYWMIQKMYHRPTVLFMVIGLFIMFPGMLTGLSSACVLTTGALILPALLAMGMPVIVAGSFVALMSVLGAVAPPICIPVMIIGGGVDMPYVGFGWPLLLASFPLAIIICLIFRYKYVHEFNVDEVLRQLPEPVSNKYGFRLFLPIIFVIGYLLLENLIPQYIIHLGVPLIFMIGALIGVWSGERFKVIPVVRAAIRAASPVVAILVGVGMFLQVLTLTGVRGWIAVNSMQLPDEIKYLGALIIPFFGSAYTGASVIGVPLVYVFSTKNAIVVTAALALMSSVGDLMPPPSMLFAYAAQMIQEKNHFKMLRFSIKYIVIILAASILMLLFAGQIARLLF